MNKKEWAMKVAELEWVRMNERNKSGEFLTDLFGVGSLKRK